MNEIDTINFRCEDDNFLEIRILGYTHPNSTDYWDGNWIRVITTVSAGAFRGDVTHDIRIGELQHFSEELNQLYNTLKGSITFETLEEQLQFEVQVTKLGQVTISGVMKDRFTNPNRLNFIMFTDQTFLKTPIKELSDILTRFPLKGKRN